MSADYYNIQDNLAVTEKKWATTEILYSRGLETLENSNNEKEMNVVLLSNRSFAQYHLGKFREAIEDAETAISLDNTYEKAYIRKASALESLKLKCANNEEERNCPVLNCFRAGLCSVPNSVIIKEAMKLSFPFMKSENSDTSTTSTSIKKKKIPSKSQRESCEILDIRGGIGPNDLKINGIY